MDAKAKLIKAAVTVFSEKGLRGATTREIAARAGVNPTTLFRLFRSKEKLYIAALDYGYRGANLVGDLTKIAEQALPFEEFIAAAIKIIFENLRRIPESHRLSLHAALEGNKQIVEWNSRTVLSKFYVIQKRLEAAIQAGEVCQVDSMLATRLIVAVGIHYYQITELYGGWKSPDFHGRQDLSKKFADLIMSGLKP